MKFTAFALSRRITIQFSETLQTHLSISNSQISHYHHPLESTFLIWEDALCNKNHTNPKRRDRNNYALISQNKLREFLTIAFWSVKLSCKMPWQWTFKKKKTKLHSSQTQYRYNNINICVYIHIHGYVYTEVCTLKNVQVYVIEQILWYMWELILFGVFFDWNSE